MAQYDYLIVGDGLTGAVFAHEAKKAGKSCLVIDKRDHIAGNVYTRKVNGSTFTSTERIFSTPPTNASGIT